MLKALFTPLQLSLGMVVCLLTSPTLAQVTSDGTVNTQVNQNGNVAEITGGETRGDNLFHSFQDFSVPTGNEAFFNNADSIDNIFSRVTGGNISNIDGLIRANGSANLFLINPAGIVFGEGARLDIGGSFYGSTASSILFEDGEFSAADLENPPLLTVNAPIGLNFRDEPGNIVNRSFAQNSLGDFVGLEVNAGNTLALVGGDINFEAGVATARGGNIFLGGLSQAGTVNINENDSLNFPEGIITLANITLDNNAIIDVSGTGGGNINIDARNLTLTAGEFGSSLIRGGITANSISNEAQAGDININVAENISLDDSSIANLVFPEGIGNSGNIIISTGSLELINGGQVNTSTLGTGNAGAIEVTATGDITAEGESSQGFTSDIVSQVNPDAEGDSGGISISTNNLNLTGGSVVDASTFGTGNAGAVGVTATGNITAEGENSLGFPSGINSGVNSNAEGDSGGVNISTNNLNLTGGGVVDASTSGRGNAGAIEVTATGDITAEGESLIGSASGIASQVSSDAEGDSGGITISTNNLNLTNGGRVAADTLGTGNAGAVGVTATGDITAEGESLIGSASGISSGVALNAEGDSGGVTISTNNLNLTNGGQVDASTRGRGNAGAVGVTATGDITAEGEDLQGFASGISSGVALNAEGDSGGVTISTTNLNLTNGGQVDASTFGRGDAGAIEVIATGDITADGENSQGFSSGITSAVNPDAEGDSGGVTISTTNLNLTNGGEVAASTRGRGNAGAIEVIATGDITADGEDSRGFVSGIASEVDLNAEGDSGGVTISTTNLNLTNGGRVGASTFGRGDAGAIEVIATGDITADGEDSQGFPSGITSLVDTGAEGDAGGITISTNNLNLINGGRVNASTGGTGDANDITIDSSESIFINGSIARFRSGISANAIIENGNGGNIFINTGSLIVGNGGTIEATNFDDIGGFNPGTGQPGNLTIAANSINLTDNARIEAATQFVGGQSGIINLQVAEDITLRNNSFISAQAFGDADGGNLNIDSRFIIAFPSSGTGNDLIAAADEGTGGNVSLNVEQLFGLSRGTATDGSSLIRLSNGTNDIDVSGSVEGSLNITADNIDPLQGATELPVNIVEPTETTQQACAANREAAAKNGLNIAGKGGVPPAPDLPLSSLNTISDGETNSASAIPAPIETAQGKIQLARGIEVTESGEIRLVAYRTDNAGNRIPEIKPNCGKV